MNKLLEELYDKILDLIDRVETAQHEVHNRAKATAKKFEHGHRVVMKMAGENVTSDIEVRFSKSLRHPRLDLGYFEEEEEIDGKTRKVFVCVGDRDRGPFVFLDDLKDVAEGWEIPLILASEAEMETTRGEMQVLSELNNRLRTLLRWLCR